MREAKTSFLPTLDFSAQAQYRINDYNLDLMGTELKMPGETYSLNADLRQVLYAGSGVKYGYQAAKTQHEIAQKSEELTMTNIVYAANLNYWSASAKRALYLLTTRYVQLIEEQTQIISERFKDGLISKTDLLQIEARLSDAKIQNSVAYKSYQLALQNLNIMMGVEPLKDVKMSDNISRLDSIPTSVMPIEQALDRRAEFSISQKNVDYQLSQLKVQRSKYLPQVAIGIQEGWGTQMLNFDGSTMFNTYAYASLSIPLFRWGAKYKNVASQRALVRSREYEVAQMRDNISQELYASYTSLVESSKQIKIAEQSTAISKESLSLNTFSYNEGKLPIIDLLSAQVVWVQANSALIQAWLQEKVAYADYNKAIGNLDY